MLRRKKQPPYTYPELTTYAERICEHIPYTKKLHAIIAAKVQQVLTATHAWAIKKGGMGSNKDIVEMQKKLLRWLLCESFGTLEDST